MESMFTINPETLQVRQEGLHYKMKGEIGVWTRPISAVELRSLKSLWDTESSAALDKNADALGKKVPDLSPEERQEVARQFLPSDSLLEQIAAALDDTVTEWDPGLVMDVASGETYAVDHEFTSDAGTVTAKTLWVAEMTSRHLTKALDIVFSASKAARELEGNSEEGSDGSGDTDPDPEEAEDHVSTVTAEP